MHRGGCNHGEVNSAEGRRLPQKACPAASTNHSGLVMPHLLHQCPGNHFAQVLLATAMLALAVAIGALLLLAIGLLAFLKRTGSDAGLGAQPQVRTRHLTDRRRYWSHGLSSKGMMSLSHAGFGHGCARTRAESTSRRYATPASPSSCSLR